MALMLLVEELLSVLPRRPSFLDCLDLRLALQTFELLLIGAVVDLLQVSAELLRVVVKLLCDHLQLLNLILVAQQVPPAATVSASSRGVCGLKLDC